ncbi:hypothetical protein CKY28_05630 [Sphingomonas lenta]|uniref:Esterase n=2 Tax=Sphingomonas lenta TaxID=1141887 RepID=A0A2A2SIP7_9SPHN|nr:PHB depolymerase family esterase [Sphingomonas lenta]PAX09154.1 hypothetical protein CKY28_05630 [Sphingomonas lenta]
MRSLSQNISRLAAARAGNPGSPGFIDRLADLPSFGSNPGALRARVHVPADLPPGAPLVVVLHGCTQTAAGYDHGSGWSTLADRHGCALLFPEQVRANNPNLCFNWFVPGDIGRKGGEAESIASMVKAMLDEHDLDRGRVFITGLSAGGAMTAVMLAIYPELFAGGAIIGGLPYGCASDIPEALRQMRERRSADGPSLAAAVRRAASGHEGPWPTLSLWHGTADTTVDVSNMDRLGRQWRHLHGIEDAAPVVTRGPGSEHRTWRAPDGGHLVEEWRIIGMGHGVPLDPTGSDRLGVAGPYMLDVGISSTAHIARSWGLVTQDVAAADLPVRRNLPRLAHSPPPEFVGHHLEDDRVAPPATAPGTIQQTIERALRSAGLMR